MIVCGPGRGSIEINAHTCDLACKPLCHWHSEACRQRSLDALKQWLSATTNRNEP